MKKPFLSSLPVMLLACLFSCHDQLDPATQQRSGVLPPANTQLEQYRPGVAGNVVTLSAGEAAIQFMVKDGVYSIGDMVFSKRQIDELAAASGTDKQARTTGLSNNAELWPDGEVFFTIDPGLENPGRVTDAINHWRDRTGITFTQRTTQPVYLEFVTSTGCASSVGRVSTGRQSILLAPGCTTGNTIHEIGHALGLFHEQSRADRDNFITVNFGNMQPGTEHNFQTYTVSGRQGFQIDGFDFNSIMLYGSNDFSNGNGPTITRKDGSTFNVNRDGLSGSDTYTINRMYYGARTRISYQVVEDYTDGGGYQIQTLDCYLQFFADDAYSVPLSLPRTNRIPIKIYDRYGGISQPTISVPGGTQSYYLGRTTTSCHYNQYGEVDGECYSEAITLANGWH